LNAFDLSLLCQRQEHNKLKYVSIAEDYLSKTFSEKKSKQSNLVTGPVVAQRGVEV
jgi:hypothetical protein